LLTQKVPKLVFAKTIKNICSKKYLWKTQFTALCFKLKMCVFARKNFFQKMKIGHF